MPHRERKSGDFAELLQFYGFALRHWRWFVLALVGMVMYTLVSFNALAMIEPIISVIEHGQVEAVQEEMAEPPDGAAQNTPLAETPVEELEAAGPATDTADEDEPRTVLDDYEDRAKSWFMRLPPVQAFLNWLLPEDNPRAGMRRMALFMGLVLGPLFVFASLLKDYASRRVIWSVMADVRVAVFERLTQLSLEFFGTQRRGELLSRLTNDMSKAQKALKVFFGKVLMEPLMLAVCLLLAFSASWQLSLIAVFTMPLTAGVSTWLGKRIRRYGSKTLEKLADVTQSINQMLNGIRVVKSFHMEEAECEEFRRRIQAQLRKAFKLVRNRSLAKALPGFFMIIPLVLMLFVASNLIQAQELDVGTLGTWIAAVTLMSSPVRKMVSAYSDLQESMAGVSRVLELINTEPTIQDAPDAVALDGVHEGVRFENVWFGYEGDEPVLKGINLEVPAGDIYAIVGETGAGKSTMLDLVPRFYDVDQGSVKIDGVDVRKIKRANLMNMIAIVGQHPFLFNRSMEENIRYGKPDATLEEVHEAARAANIHDFLMSLPDGYQTNAGETGDRLSGGQRQCVTIARAILRNAPILILDEATSSLDAESEALVQEALNNLMKERTTFVIAHRLSTIRHANQIVVIKNGRIAEQGNHDDLIELGGEYERLYRFQFGPADPTVNGGS